MGLITTGRAKDRLQQMAFGGDGLGGWPQRRIAFRGDNQSFVPFHSHLTVGNLNPANVAVVVGV